MRSSEAAAKIAQALHQVGEIHHMVFSDTDGNDDDWARAVTAAGEATGELVWRLPLHPEYARAIDGRWADLMNVPESARLARSSPPSASVWQAPRSPALSIGRSSKISTSTDWQRRGAGKLIARTGCFRAMLLAA